MVVAAFFFVRCRWSIFWFSFLLVFFSFQPLCLIARLGRAKETHSREKEKENKNRSKKEGKIEETLFTLASTLFFLFSSENAREKKRGGIKKLFAVK